MSVLSISKGYLPGLQDLQTQLVSQGYTVQGTFKFPRIPNAMDEKTPFSRSDVNVASDLIFQWHKNVTKIVGVHWQAFPEVLQKDRKTTTPLHYHALFSPVNEAKFLEVAPRKWRNLLEHRFPKCRLRREPLWLREIDRNDPHCIDACEGYAIKQQDFDWNAQNALRSDQLHMHEQSTGLYRFQGVA